MDSKTSIPSFTVSLRGYDRVEVDEYLDSLADTLGHVDDAQEQNRRLQAHIGRLTSRIKDLEDRINADTPRTGAILGERIGILLRSAEETATETMERAEAQAAQVVAEAGQRLADAEESARVTLAGGQEQARRIEAAARAEAAEIISEAEARAAARTRQIEQWAEQVVSHTRAEEARMLREQQEKRHAALADLHSIGEQRDAVAATLAQLRETLGQALGLVVPAAPAGERVLDGPAPGEPVLDGPAPEAEAEADGAWALTGPEPAAEAEPGLVGDAAEAPEAAVSLDGATAPEVPALEAAPADAPEDLAPAPHEDDEAGEPATGRAAFDGEDEPQDWQPATADSRPPFDGEAADEPVTDQIEAVHPGDYDHLDGHDHDGMATSASDDPEFEAKLEAWVSEGARHFKRG